MSNIAGAFNVPSIGPSGMGNGLGMGGMPIGGNGSGGANGAPAAPAEPKDFMELLGSQGSGTVGSGSVTGAGNGVSSGSGLSAEDQAAANKILQLFGQMLNAPAPPAATDTPAGTPTSTPAAKADWETLFDDFNVEYKEPDFLTDTAKLTKLFNDSLGQIDFAAGMSSENPNDFMRAAFTTMLIKAVQIAHVAAKQSTTGAIPNALRTYAQRSYSKQQLGAANNVEAVPQSLGFIAQSVAERFTRAQPNATPEQVRQAVTVVMQNMQKAFQPTASNPAPINTTDWAQFL